MRCNIVCNSDFVYLNRAITGDEAVESFIETESVVREFLGFVFIVNVLFRDCVVDCLELFVVVAETMEECYCA